MSTQLGNWICTAAMLSQNNSISYGFAGMRLQQYRGLQERCPTEGLA